MLSASFGLLSIFVGSDMIVKSGTVEGWHLEADMIVKSDADEKSASGGSDAAVLLASLWGCISSV